MAHIHNILVPVDGSPASIGALAQAVALAQDLGARVRVLNVRAPDQFEVGSETEVAGGAREQSDREMDAAVEAAQGILGERLDRRVEYGDPLLKILETAAEEEVDLIVMGTHGRVGRLHTLVGSVAEAVVRSTPCPVMIVREPNGEQESFAERIHGRATIADQVRPSR